MANGEVLTTDCLVQATPLVVQRIHEFHVDVFTLHLGGCDAVLGVQWLLKLGPILWDFEHLTMQFSYDTRWGLSLPYSTLVYYKGIVPFLKSSFKGIWL